LFGLINGTLRQSNSRCRITPVVRVCTCHHFSTVARTLVIASKALSPTIFRMMANAVNSDDGERCEAVSRIACDRLHYVNPKTGKVLGDDDE
jgi:hypothetical protein